MKSIVGVNEGMKHAAGDAKPSAAPPSLQKPSAAHESIQKLSAAYPSLQKPSVTPQSLQKPFATPPILQKPPAALSSLQDLIKQNNDLIARVSNLGKTSSDDGHVGAENKGEWHLLTYLRPASFLVTCRNYSYIILDFQI